MNRNTQLGKAIRSSGLRMTRQRKTILELIEQSQEHLDVESIHAILKARGLRIGMATIYRTVNLLKEMGLVHEHHLGEDHSHFEATSEVPHYHFTCKKCGRIIEFEAPPVDEVIQNLVKEMNVKVSEVHLFISGICAECRTQQEEQT